MVRFSEQDMGDDCRRSTQRHEATFFRTFFLRREFFFHLEQLKRKKVQVIIKVNGVMPAPSCCCACVRARALLLRDAAACVGLRRP